MLENKGARWVAPKVAVVIPPWKMPEGLGGGKASAAPPETQFKCDKTAK